MSSTEPQTAVDIQKLIDRIQKVINIYLNKKNDPLEIADLQKKFDQLKQKFDAKYNKKKTPPPLPPRTSSPTPVTKPPPGAPPKPTLPPATPTGVLPPASTSGSPASITSTPSPPISVTAPPPPPPGMAPTAAQLTALQKKKSPAPSIAPPVPSSSVMPPPKGLPFSSADLSKGNLKKAPEPTTPARAPKNPLLAAIEKGKTLKKIKKPAQSPATKTINPFAGGTGAATKMLSPMQPTVPVVQKDSSEIQNIENTLNTLASTLKETEQELENEIATNNASLKFFEENPKTIKIREMSFFGDASESVMEEWTEKTDIEKRAGYLIKIIENQSTINNLIAKKAVLTTKELTEFINTINELQQNIQHMQGTGDRLLNFLNALNKKLETTTQLLQKTQKNLAKKDTTISQEKVALAIAEAKKRAAEQEAAKQQARKAREDKIQELDKAENKQAKTMRVKLLKDIKPLLGRYVLETKESTPGTIEKLIEQSIHEIDDALSTKTLLDAERKIKDADKAVSTYKQDFPWDVDFIHWWEQKIKDLNKGITNAPATRLLRQKLGGRRDAMKEEQTPKEQALHTQITKNIDLLNQHVTQNKTTETNVSATQQLIAQIKKTIAEYKKIQRVEAQKIEKALSPIEGEFNLQKAAIQQQKTKAEVIQNINNQTAIIKTHITELQNTLLGDTLTPDNLNVFIKQLDNTKELINTLNKMYGIGAQTHLTQFNQAINNILRKLDTWKNRPGLKLDPDLKKELEQRYAVPKK